MRNNNKTLLISGYYGFGNAGDEAILAAMVQQFRENIPGVRIIVLSESPGATESEHGVEAFQRKDFKGIFRLMRNVDVFVSGGGGLVQDTTGFTTVLYYLGLVQLARLLGKKVACYAQGFGPLSQEKSRKAAKFIMNQVQLITFRDEKSSALAREIGIGKPPVHITADPVFILRPPDEEALAPAAKEEGIEGDSLRIGISVRPWESQVDYPTIVARAADMFVEKLKASVFIFPFQHSQDYHVCRQVKERMKNPAHLVENIYPVKILIGLLGKMDMILGMRLHSLIFSAAQGIPSMGICYDPKVSSMMEMLDLPCADVQNLSEDAIFQQFLELYKNMDGVRDALIARTKQLKEKAQENVSLLKGLL